ncbi:MAG TPA: hypothetical protein VER79_08080, partial [Candidatus Limnocylindrales bacterium]|nr:hypothetical protein [Candidatus Limnocylindrales bacterium]
AYARRLLDDALLPAPAAALLRDEYPAYLLGSITADGHSGAGLRREDTHFYAYDQPITAPLHERMLAAYPRLADVTEPAGRAFLAGYVGHLALDEVWTEGVTRPYFLDSLWGTSSERFLMLNVLLLTLDERDRARLTPEMAEALNEAGHGNWLPFLPDAALLDWRNLIAGQLKPGAPSQTVPIISERTGLSQADIRALVTSPASLNERLWAFVPRAVVPDTEARMLAIAANRVAEYLK